MNKILIIEDDRAITNLLKIALTQEGYDVLSAPSAREGIDCIVKNVIDLLILDLGLPDLDGKNVIETVRSFSSDLPILVVSARSDEEEKVRCLDSGANDYIQKPFSTKELLARVRASLRSLRSEEKKPAVFVDGNLRIDFAAHSVFVSDAEIRLTNYEYKILSLLAQNVGKTLTHNFIVSKVWGEGGNDANGLRVFMAGIRRKIGDDPYRQELIRTDIGIGYRMNKLS
jgi:two-component system, OmpR family, KDP operon response regulator KdpE